MATPSRLVNSPRTLQSDLQILDNLHDLSCGNQSGFAEDSRIEKTTHRRILDSLLRNHNVCFWHRELE